MRKATTRLYFNLYLLLINEFYDILETRCFSNLPFPIIQLLFIQQQSAGPTNFPKMTVIMIFSCTVILVNPFIRKKSNDEQSRD